MVINQHTHLQLYIIFINTYYIGYENVLSLETVYYENTNTGFYWYTQLKHET